MKIASIGMLSTSGTLLVTMEFAVVMPGRSVVSASAIVILTSKTFASAFGLCSPTLATEVTVPVSRLDGSLSSETLTGWPTAIFRTSISFTYVTDSI